MFIDCYNQKMMYPWYLPSVNCHLSPMNEENWNLTPDDTNFAETAHVACNTKGGISRPLLTAILEYVINKLMLKS